MDYNIIKQILYLFNYLLFKYWVLLLKSRDITPNPYFIKNDKIMHKYLPYTYANICYLIHLFYNNKNAFIKIMIVH